MMCVYVCVCVYCVCVCVCMCVGVRILWLGGIFGSACPISRLWQHLICQEAQRQYDLNCVDGMLNKNKSHRAYTNTNLIHAPSQTFTYKSKYSHNTKLHTYQRTYICTQPPAIHTQANFFIQIRIHVLTYAKHTFTNIHMYVQITE